MKINELLNSVEDHYSDLYYMTKDLLTEGTTLSFETEMTNLTGLLIVSGPKMRKSIIDLETILDALGLRIMNNSPSYRMSLLSTRKKVSHIIFGDEAIELNIITKNSNTSFSGIARDVLEYKKIVSLLESISFEKKDNVEVTIKLVTPSLSRQTFEDRLNTDAYVSDLKKKTLGVINSILGQQKVKPDLVNTEIEALIDLDIFDRKLTKDKMVEQLKNWTTQTGSNFCLIKSFPSVFEQEKYANFHNWGRDVNYANVLKKFTKKKLL